MSKAVLIALLLLSSLPTRAQEWTTTDKQLAVAAGAVLMLDWGQTLYVARHPQQFVENNRLLGEHPSVVRVNTYFLTVLAAGIGATAFVPDQYRTYLLGGALAFEIGVVARNRHVGIRLSF